MGELVDFNYQQEKYSQNKYCNILSGFGENECKPVTLTYGPAALGVSLKYFDCAYKNKL